LSVYNIEFIKMKNLLNKWLGGSTTWDEEKQLRRTASNDDFLAEAMEGYDAFPNSNHAAAVDRLKARLPKGKQQNKGLLISLPRVAAAAAVIGLIGTLFWVQQRIEEPAILSQNSPQVNTSSPLEKTEAKESLFEEAPANEIIASADQAPNIPSEIKINKEKSTNKPILKKKSTPKPTITPEPLANVQEDYASAEADAAVSNLPSEPVVEEVEGIIVMTEPTPEKIVVKPAQEVEMAAEAATYDARVIASQGTPATSMDADATTKMPQLSKMKVIAPPKVNYYVGQVQNEDGQPLSGVKIVGLNTSFNTMTEMNGDFILKTDGQLTKIAVSKDGYHTRKIAINQYSDFLNVALVKKTTKVPGSEELLTSAPKPVQGFVHFFDYLAKNTVYPQAVKDRGMEREVEIRFFIDENGTPTDLKVSNPDAYGFDKEAIRLLENGPKWQPANSHARYYVHFEK